MNYPDACAATTPPLRHFRLTTDSAGIAHLTIDVAHATANTLTLETLDELNQVMDGLEKIPPKGLIVRSGKKGSFIVGADIHAFSNLKTAEAAHTLVERGYQTFDRLAAQKYPTLALISGACAGGGLELALACTRRIVIDTSNTKLSLPEVMLGIVPGWGGMKRLPALIGAPAALDMMLTGRGVDASRSVRLGLADFKVAPRLAEVSASRHVLTPQPPRRGARLGRWLNTGVLRQLVAYRALKTVQKRDPYAHYPAPRAILEIWAKHNGNALKAPATLNKLFSSSQVPNLLRVYRLQERLKANGKPQQVDSEAAAYALTRVHVIGAGVMGGDIAAWCALKGLTVTLQDSSPDRIAEAQVRAAKLFSKRIRDERARRHAFDRLIPDAEGNGIARADVVIEAIIENADAKRALYRSIEPRMKIDAVLATNTSSLLLQDLYPALHLPQRLVGLHFFNPVASLPLVEVVRSGLSGPAYYSNALRLAGMLGKLPLPVKDVPGFLVNAVLAPYMHEAIRCVDEGMAPEAVDEAMIAFGMPVGPIELADRVGLDIVQAAGAQLVGTTEPPRVLKQLLTAKHLGQKSGKGFYPWRDGRPVKNGTGRPDAALAQRLLAPLRAQAEKQLDIGAVEDADLVDAGMIFGSGFAPFTGGPLHSQR